ncbi:MAG: hypothetical protein ACTSWD_04820 [Candidatus Heimdallarchaeota archaeon]
MMNPIVEEAMSNLIRRVDKLEELVKKFIESFNRNPQAKTNHNPNKPTQSQINYIRSLGGSVDPEMNKEQAGFLIDELKESRGKRPIEEIKVPKVNEPKEVDTDNAGILDGDLL